MGIVLLTGCTAAQVRWDATNIRKQVMVYYNDQIMDNLIRAKNHLPFVHVDITLLTSQGSSQISGTIGAGENRTNTNASKPMAGMLGTITKAVMRPFAYSVSPQGSETLTISTAPALGSQTLTAPSAYPPTLEATKETTTLDPQGKITGTTVERTKEAVPRKNIYELYEELADCYVKDGLTLPSKDEYVPGPSRNGSGNTTTSQEGRGSVVIVETGRTKGEEDNQLAYYEFCKELFLNN